MHGELARVFQRSLQPAVGIAVQPPVQPAADLGQGGRTFGVRFADLPGEILDVLCAERPFPDGFAVRSEELQKRLARCLARKLEGVLIHGPARDVSYVCLPAKTSRFLIAILTRSTCGVNRKQVTFVDRKV